MRVKRAQNNYLGTEPLKVLSCTRPFLVGAGDARRKSQAPEQRAVGLGKGSSADEPSSLVRYLTGWFTVPVSKKALSRCTFSGEIQRFSKSTNWLTRSRLLREHSRLIGKVDQQTDDSE